MAERTSYVDKWRFQKMKYDYLIVGAGLFGATLAHLLHADGKKVLVIDRNDFVGGMCHTYKDRGITVHEFGAHIFRTDKRELWDFINEFCEFKPFVNSPLARVGDKLYNLPFNMNTYQQLWGVTIPYEAKKKILEDIVPNDNPKNLEEYALSKVGKTIYNLFIKEYTEKQWGRPCTELPASILGRLPLRYTFDNNYYANKPYQGIPVFGYTEFIWKLMIGCDIKECTPYSEKWKNMADKVIYTGSIDEFYNYKYGELEYRSLKFEVEEFEDTDDMTGNAVINYTTKDYDFTRVIEHKHFLDEKSHGTILSFEFPTMYDGTNERYYPIETERNLMLYKKYADIETDVIFAGRLGQYRYTDMEQTMLNAFRLADRLKQCEYE